MYLFLQKYLPLKLANIIMLVWYLALIILCIVFSGIDQAEFRYGNI